MTIKSHYWKFTDFEEETIQSTRILGYEFENDFLKITKSGLIIVKVNNGKGFAWDGCTPKWTWWDLEFGTPDGRILPNRKAITQKASKFHDALNQFAPAEISRKAIDGVFIDLLEEVNFRPRNIYYSVVRRFGRFFMTKRAA